MYVNNYHESGFLQCEGLCLGNEIVTGFDKIWLFASVRTKTTLLYNHCENKLGVFLLDVSTKK